MDAARALIDFILHIDVHLAALSADYGVWMYAIIGLIVFCETGLVVLPLLPGDSLLFAAGALAATGAFNVHILAVVLIACAIAGDTVNYAVGRRLGVRAYKLRFVKAAYVERTQQFYSKYGGKTIVLARFVPIVRTFAPFVAGIAQMDYAKFIVYNVAGGILWVASILYAGYFFGNIPVVRDNFGLVVIGVIVVSVLPIIVEFARARFGRSEAPAA